MKVKKVIKPAVCIPAEKEVAEVLLYLFSLVWTHWRDLDIRFYFSFKWK